MSTMKPRRSRLTAPTLRPVDIAPNSDVTENVLSYLRIQGWEPGVQGVAGALWRNPSAPAALAVTKQVRLGSVEWVGIVERLANWAQQTPVELAQEIQYQFIDVTRLRASNELISASIPLAAASSIVTSAAAMLRAAGSTSVRLRGSIAGNFSRLGDEVAAQARMAHTEEGSYIVPLLMPLSMPSPQVHSQPRIDGMEDLSDQYEPAERRLTRTLAQALVALDAHVIQPAREVKRGDLHGFVESGGSRELVVAVSRVLAEPSIATFEASFGWAGAVQPPTAAPARVTVPAAAVELLEQAAYLLRDASLSPTQLLSGPIVEIRMPPGDPFGEIAIQTVRAGRPCEVRVRLGAKEVDLAHQWAIAKRAVLVEGAVESQRGKPLRIVKPRRVLPVDETMLADAN